LRRGASRHHIDLLADAGQRDLEDLGLVRVTAIHRARSSATAGIGDTGAGLAPIQLHVLGTRTPHPAMKVEQRILVQLAHASGLRFPQQIQFVSS
jgi:hypothetical protein